MKHKVLIIGLGRIGMGYDLTSAKDGAILSHAKAFSTHPGFELSGGVDPDENRRDLYSAYYKGWVGEDIATAMRETSPDVVIIASPTADHYRCMMETLAYGKPKVIICEKPLSDNFTSAEKMVLACRDAGCELFVNYLRRVEPGALEVRRRILSNEIKPPIKGVTWYTKGLIRNGSHFSNLLELWLGPIKDFKIINAGRIWDENDPEPDVQLEFDLGTVTFLAGTEENFSHYEIQLLASNGCLRYEHGGSKITWQAAVQDSDSDEYTVLSKHDEKIVTASDKLPLLVAEEILIYLAGGETKLCSGESALRSLNWLLKIRAAR